MAASTDGNAGPAPKAAKGSPSAAAAGGSENWQAFVHTERSSVEAAGFRGNSIFSELGKRWRTRKSTGAPN